MRVFRPSLVALALATLTACQAPLLVARPRVVVNAGSLSIPAGANLAISLNFRALQGYHVAGTTTVGPLAKIVATVTGPYIADPKGLLATVDPTSCQNGVATIGFTSVPVGPVTIHVDAEDAQANTLSYGDAMATIVPEQVAQVTVNCSDDTGGLDVVVASGS